MISRCAVVAALCLVLFTLSAHAQISSWAINNRQVTKDGVPFLIKGVNYSPIVPGSSLTEENQWGDLFHSGWSHLHDRDIPLMRQAGINAIRIFNLHLKDPISKQDLDHVSFFDKLYNGGVNPIYVIIAYPFAADFSYLGPFDTEPSWDDSFQTTDGKWYQIDASQEQSNYIQRQISSNIVAEIALEYGSHPAVLGFNIGEQLNSMVDRSNCKFWEFLDSIAARVKQVPNKLTLTTIKHDIFITLSEANKCHSLSNFDAWGLSVFTGNATEGFGSTFSDFAALSSKGLLITEFGSPASTRDNNDNFVMLPDNSFLQAEYFRVHWEDIVNNSAVCAGGFVYSWVDEWWILGADGQQDYNNEFNPDFPGLRADEESYGINAVLVDCDHINQPALRRDQLLPRMLYFMMGKMFGAWSTIPAEAYLPISYPRCNGEWIGEPVPLSFSPVSYSTPVAPTIPPVEDYQPSVTVPATIINPPVVVDGPVTNVPLTPPVTVDAPSVSNSPFTSIPPVSVTPVTDAPLNTPEWIQEITATVTILLKVGPSTVEVNSVANALSSLLNLPRNAIPSINIDIDRSTDTTTIVQFVIQNVQRSDGSRVDPVNAALGLRNLIASNDQRITSSNLLRGMEVVPNDQPDQVSGSRVLIAAPILCLIAISIVF